MPALTGRKLLPPDARIGCRVPAVCSTIINPCVAGLPMGGRSIDISAPASEVWFRAPGGYRRRGKVGRCCGDHYVPTHLCVSYTTHRTLAEHVAYNLTNEIVITKGNEACQESVVRPLTAADHRPAGDAPPVWCRTPCSSRLADGRVAAAVAPSPVDGTVRLSVPAGKPSKIGRVHAPPGQA